MAEETITIIKKYISSGVIAHWVNKLKIREHYHQLVVKHYDKPGILASIMYVLREGSINIEEVENIIFDGGMVACCTMKLDMPATLEMLEGIKNNPNVITLSHIEV